MDTRNAFCGLRNIIVTNLLNVIKISQLYVGKTGVYTAFNRNFSSVFLLFRPTLLQVTYWLRPTNENSGFAIKVFAPLQKYVYYLIFVAWQLRIMSSSARVMAHNGTSHQKRSDQNYFIGIEIFYVYFVKISISGVLLKVNFEINPVEPHLNISVSYIRGYEVWKFPKSNAKNGTI